MSMRPCSLVSPAKASRAARNGKGLTGVQSAAGQVSMPHFSLSGAGTYGESAWVWGPSRPLPPGRILNDMGARALVLLALAVPALGAVRVSPPLRPGAAPAASASAAIPAAALRAAVPALEPYERRGAGLLVVDLKDSSALHQSVGNRQARRLVSAALEFAEDASASFDGTVMRRLGDGQLIAFPSAGQAIDAAFAVQSRFEEWSRALGAPGLSLRAAVHGGRVLIDPAGPDAHGSAVERALSLASRGRGGDIAFEPALLEHPRMRERMPGSSLALAPDGVALLRPAAAPLGATRVEQPRLAVSRFTARATLFAELRDWSAAYELHGRRKAFESSRLFRQALAEEVARFGGELVKTPGDGGMAVFRSPAAARVGALAGPDEIVVSETLLKDAEAAALLAGREPETAALKGFRASVRVIRLP